MPAARHSGGGNDSITRLEPRNVFTRSLHLPGQLGPEDTCFPRLSNTKHEFRDRQHRFGHEGEIADVAVTCRHRGRVYRDQDFVVLGSGFVHLLELEKIGRSVLGVQNRFHKGSLWGCCLFRMFTRSSCQLLERADSSGGADRSGGGKKTSWPPQGQSPLESLGKRTAPAPPRLGPREERLTAVANEYVQDPHATLVVSPDNQSRQDLNDVIHRAMQREGYVNREDHQVSVLVPRQEITGTDRLWAERYEAGDVLRYSRGSRALVIEPGDARVERVDAKSNQVTIRTD